MRLADDSAYVESLSTLSRFRTELHTCLPRRADALFELCDATLRANGPVTPPNRAVPGGPPTRPRGMYDALDHGRIQVDRLRRRPLASLPLPRAADGRIVLAVDVSPRLRPDAPCSPDRLFCHVSHPFQD